MDTPDWLTRRGGSLKPGPQKHTWYAVFTDQLQYRLRPRPVGGEFGCDIVQTNNGKLIPSESIAKTESGAVEVGLQDLAKHLGWI
ncbi:MAG: hypothetical protein ACFCD0_01450 [Gemmataceae bacterium]